MLAISNNLQYTTFEVRTQLLAGQQVLRCFQDSMAIAIRSRKRLELPAALRSRLQLPMLCNAWACPPYAIAGFALLY
jgi:hypothetical protein